MEKKSRMFDIITFGSATKDILVKPKNLTVLKYEKDFSTGKGVCFPMGSKIDIDDIKFNTGGGGTNTAATFSLQGFKTAFCGMVGQDLSGQEIVNELKKLKVNTSFVLKTNKKPTNHSIVISSEGQDRTILAYRGASELMVKRNIPFNKLKTLLRPELRTGRDARILREAKIPVLKAKWIYLAPLSVSLCDNFGDIVNFAFKNKIKIAVNPGIAQLSLPKKEKLEEIFKRINVLFLNQEEASFLTKIPFDNEKEIFKIIDEICPGVAVMTKGGEGVVVSDGKYVYSAKPSPNRNIVDTTGAGDSFASGFLSDYIRHNGDIEKAIQLGMANSQGCLSEVGAKNGLLKKGQKFERVKVTKEMCDNNICIVK